MSYDVDKDAALRRAINRFSKAAVAKAFDSTMPPAEKLSRPVNTELVQSRYLLERLIQRRVNHEV